MAKKIKDENTTNKNTFESNEVWIVTSDSAAIGTRGGGRQALNVEELALNVNIFVQQMGKILESTPETLGKFHFDEFEIHAEVNADGTIAVLGSGIHAGVGGGLRFVFKRGASAEK